MLLTKKKRCHTKFACAKFEDKLVIFEMSESQEEEKKILLDKCVNDVMCICCDELKVHFELDT